MVFDVNETMSDLSPLDQRFADLGVAESLSTLWFTAVLRDGIGLAAAGSLERLAVIGAETLRVLLPTVRLDRELDAAVDHVMSGFNQLGVHADVVAGVAALRAAGRRLVTLSNGSAQVAETLLTTAGIRDSFEHLLSVEDAGIWKPAAGAYHHAARMCGSAASDMVLVSVHPWDIDGAARAGLGTAWLDRHHSHYPRYFTPPDHTVHDLSDLAGALGA